MNFEFLYIFQGHGHSLIELKKHDPEGTLTRDEKYFWLFIKDATHEITRLSFVEKEEDDGVQFREFEEGQLTFDSGIGELILDDGTALAMDRLFPDELDESLVKHINEYLSS